MKQKKQTGKTGHSFGIWHAWPAGHEILSGISGAKVWPTLLIPLMFGVSCCDTKPSDCFNSSGEQTQWEIQIGEGFHSLSIHHNISLVVHPSDTDRLMLNGPENLLEKINFSVRDSMLTVKNLNTCNWVRQLDQEFRLDMYTSDLREIRYSSYGDIHFSDTLKQDVFILEVWDGFGDVLPLIHTRRATFKLHTGGALLKPAGRTGEMDVYSSSYGRFDGLDLEAGHVFFQQYGSNDAFVYAGETLRVLLMATGNIYHRGPAQPEIINHQGSGQLFRLP
ncbi:MAG: DUF2807 domain-containing protein [Bacteroidales bacterium]